MKLRYSATIALALWLGVVAWVSAMIVAKPSVRPAYNDGDGSAAIVQLQLSLTHNQRLLDSLDELDGTHPYAAVELAVAPAPEDPVEDGVTQTGSPAAGAPPSLSLILSSDRGRRAVVDGEWTSPGSLLADGSRVRAIGAHHVLIQRQNGETLELRMPAPFAAAGTHGHDKGGPQ